MPQLKMPLSALTDDEEAAIQAGIAQDPDNPEITEEQWALARPAKDVLPPALYAALTKRGRPLSSNKRVLISLRLDPEAVATFKATGPGWQGRINDAVVRGASELRQTGDASEAGQGRTAVRRLRGG